jgi:hypothetical protein
MGKVKDLLFTDTELENAHELLDEDDAYREWSEEYDATVSNLYEEEEECQR